MIYIDNLCEFVRLVIDTEYSGDLTPQNKELISTSELVQEIAHISNKKIWNTRIFNWCIILGNKISKRVRRAFANDCYALNLSDYFNFSYCVVDFKESIKRTES